MKGLGRWLLALVLTCGLLALTGAPASAKTCRTVDGHRICLISTKRSTKNYWEYRAVVEVDGDRRPLEVYDCRRQQRTTANGKRIPFVPQGPGELICRLLYR
ncbi:MAG: hypothetical protein AAF289_17850 [Cyanobacteria bacterium P01_A01_bin.135]